MISGVSPVADISGRRTADAPGKSNADFAKILEDFKKEAAKTPAERARDAVLKKHDLSEEKYKQLPPKEKASIDAEIVEAVKRVTQRKVADSAHGGETTLEYLRDRSAAES